MGNSDLAIQSIGYVLLVLGIRVYTDKATFLQCCSPLNCHVISKSMLSMLKQVLDRWSKLVPGESSIVPLARSLEESSNLH